MTHRLVRLGRALFLLFCLPTFAMSADLMEGGPEIMGCTATLSGLIENGDATKLDELVARSIANPDAEITLCLDSPGGNFAEAIRIAEKIVMSMGTAIGPGQHCESACAIVFMAGYAVPDDPGYGAPKHRRLHPQGKLGFHAPDLSVDSGLYSEATVRTAYSVALMSIGELIDLTERTFIRFPNNRVLEMLRTPPEDMRYIETVADAILWGVEIHPVAVPDLSFDEMILNACRNAELEILSEVPSADDLNVLASESAEGLIAEVQNMEIAVKIVTVPRFFVASAKNRGGGAAPCFVEVNRLDTDLPLGMVGESYAFFDTLHGFMFYPSRTRIADIAEGPRTQHSAFAQRLSRAKVTQGGQQAPLSCRLPGPTAEIANVSTYVNLRADTSISARVVRQIALGETVTLGNGPFMAGPERGQAYCEVSCERLRQEPEFEHHLTDVEWCIDDNVIWYEVIDDRGNRGYVSRKFLR